MKKPILLLLCLLVGCAPAVVRYTSMNTSARSTAISPESVQIFTSALPDREYIELGSMTGGNGTAEDNELFVLIKTECAKYYGDAVIITGRSTSGDFTATCVQYK